jgi:hypothetical protein
MLKNQNGNSLKTSSNENEKLLKSVQLTMGICLPLHEPLAFPNI